MAQPAEPAPAPLVGGLADAAAAALEETGLVLPSEATALAASFPSAQSAPVGELGAAGISSAARVPDAFAASEPAGADGAFASTAASPPVVPRSVDSGAPGGPVVAGAMASESPEAAFGRLLHDLAVAGREAAGSVRSAGPDPAAASQAAAGYLDLGDFASRLDGLLSQIRDGGNVVASPWTHLVIPSAVGSEDLARLHSDMVSLAAAVSGSRGVEDLGSKTLGDRGPRRTRPPRSSRSSWSC